MNDKKPQPAWRRREDDDSEQRREPRARRQHQDKRRQPRSDRGPEDHELRPLEVTVRDGGIEQALRILKTKMSKDGVLGELRCRRHAEKPSERKRRKRREAMKRLRKSKGKQRHFGWKRGGRSGVKASVAIAQNAPVETNDEKE